MEVTSVTSREIAPVGTLETQEKESHSEQENTITSVSPLTWTLHTLLLEREKRKKKHPKHMLILQNRQTTNRLTPGGKKKIKGDWVKSLHYVAEINIT